MPYIHPRVWLMYVKSRTHDLYAHYILRLKLIRGSTNNPSRPYSRVGQGVPNALAAMRRSVLVPSHPISLSRMESMSFSRYSLCPTAIDQPFLFSLSAALCLFLLSAPLTRAQVGGLTVAATLEQFDNTLDGAISDVGFHADRAAWHMHSKGTALIEAWKAANQQLLDQAVGDLAAIERDLFEDLSDTVEEIDYNIRQRIDQTEDLQARVENMIGRMPWVENLPVVYGYSPLLIHNDLQTTRSIRLAVEGTRFGTNEAWIEGLGSRHQLRGTATRRSTLIDAGLLPASSKTISQMNFTVRIRHVEDSFWDFLPFVEPRVDTLSYELSTYILPQTVGEYTGWYEVNKEVERSARRSGAVHEAKGRRLSRSFNAKPGWKIKPQSGDAPSFIQVRGRHPVDSRLLNAVVGEGQNRMSIQDHLKRGTIVWVVTHVNDGRLNGISRDSEGESFSIDIEGDEPGTFDGRGSMKGYPVWLETQVQTVPERKVISPGTFTWGRDVSLDLADATRWQLSIELYNGEKRIVEGKDRIVGTYEVEPNEDESAIAIRPVPASEAEIR